jgi:hypothetical protein
MVEKLWGFEDFSPSSGMLLATVNAGKSAQTCPKFPKFAKICQNLPKDETLKYHQNLSLVFFKNKNFYL